jgi:hypothetical protein
MVRRVGSPDHAIRQIASGIARHRLLEAATVLLAFTLLGAVLYHTPLVRNPSGLAAGLGRRDDDAYVWLLSWPAHAILHGLNLLEPKIVFAPDGYNLARATPTLTYGLVLAPLTWLAGPVVTYNVVLLSVPALNGSVAYAVCRRFGTTRPAAAVGGCVFAIAGVVSWAELGAPTTGSGVFVGLALLITVDLLDGRSHWPRAVLLGLVLLAQLYFSSEQFALIVLYGVFAVGVTWAIDRERRDAVRRALRPLAAAGGIVCIGGLPYFLTFALGGSLSHANPNLYPSDLLGFVVPSSLMWLGHSSFTSVTSTFIAEGVTAYVGVGLVAIIVWYVTSRWRQEAAVRILGIVLAALVICSLGTHLTIAGNSTIPLPWAVITKLPLLRYSLPSRTSLFTALAVALGLALWLSSSRSSPRWVVAVAACALLIPNPAARWSTSLHVPKFFTSGAAARQLAGERVLALPFLGPDDADQAESRFAFSLAGGYLGQYPSSYGSFIGAKYLYERSSPPGAPAAVAQLVHAKGVDTVVLDASAPGPWRQLLSGLGVSPVSRLGVLIYDLSPPTTRQQNSVPADDTAR